MNIFKHMNTITQFLILSIIIVGCYSSSSNHHSSFSSNSILLRDVETLILRKGEQTTFRRSEAVPQLLCVGNPSSHSLLTTSLDICNKESNKVDIIKCKNIGFDGEDVTWECESELDDNIKLGKFYVICEGYEYSEDPYILKGSCGIEYELEYIYQKEIPRTYQEIHQVVVEETYQEVPLTYQEIHQVVVEETYQEVPLTYQTGMKETEIVITKNIKVYPKVKKIIYYPSELNILFVVFVVFVVFVIINICTSKNINGRSQNDMDTSDVNLRTENTTNIHTNTTNIHNHQQNYSSEVSITRVSESKFTNSIPIKRSTFITTIPVITTTTIRKTVPVTTTTIRKIVPVTTTTIRKTVPVTTTTTIKEKTDKNTSSTHISKSYGKTKRR